MLTSVNFRFRQVEFGYTTKVTEMRACICCGKLPEAVGLRIGIMDPRKFYKNYLAAAGILLAGLVVCPGSGIEKNGGEVVAVFTIHQESDVYHQSDYGEAPQFAIWLEDKKSGDIRTVFVTRRTATGDFEGKAECPVSLPAWIGAFRKETGRDDFPTPMNPASEAVTGATPKVKEFRRSVEIPRGSGWYYYVEVNVSGDYTPKFPSLRPDGTLDSQGNGQPSIIYRGELSGVPGDHSVPVLIGRTDQLSFSPEINADLDDIGNAGKVFSTINARCLDKVP